MRQLDAFKFLVLIGLYIVKYTSIKIYCNSELISFDLILLKKSLKSGRTKIKKLQKLQLIQLHATRHDGHLWPILG